MMEKFATFETVADFAPLADGGEYQLPVVVSLRKVFEIYNKLDFKITKKCYFKTFKRNIMLEIPDIDVAEINEFVIKTEFEMLCMILEILVFFHNKALAIDARQGLNKK